MESTLTHSHGLSGIAGGTRAHSASHEGARIASKATTVAFWIVTGLFCLEMSFTAYYELLPQGAQAFARLGFSSHSFPMELSLAKIAGVLALLLAVVPPRLKEWAYAGFAINLVSAVIAHASIHDVPLAFIPSTLTGVLWALSYFFWRRRQAAQTFQRKGPVSESH